MIPSFRSTLVGDFMVLNQIGNIELEELLRKQARLQRYPLQIKNLADYVSKNYMKTIFMTADQLADTVGVSQEVFRFV